MDAFADEVTAAAQEEPDPALVPVTAAAEQAAAVPGLPLEERAGALQDVDEALRRALSATPDA